LKNARLFLAFFESTVEAEQMTKRTCPDFSSEILAVEGVEFKHAEKSACDLTCSASSLNRRVVMAFKVAWACTALQTLAKHPNFRLAKRINPKIMSKTVRQRSEQCKRSVIARPQAAVVGAARHIHASTEYF
jgi:hypothetical protein